MSIQFGGNGEIVPSPLLIAGGFFGVGSEAVVLDGFDGDA
jgi:hypothetical protein